MIWFWNSKAMDFVENLSIKITNYIWRKRRAAKKK
jgi:hypothetical protein